MLMKILKWVLQPIYLFLLIVVVALYVNRHSLFPDEVARSIEADALVAKVDRLISELQTDTEKVQSLAQRNDVERVVDFPIAHRAVSSNDEGMAENDLPPAEAAVPLQPSSSAPEGETAPQTRLTSSAERQPHVNSKPQKRAAEGREASTQIPEVATTPPSPGYPQAMAIWRAARDAAWQGDLAASVLRYRELIELQPDNYDAYGEMGNVLLAQQQQTAAIDAYVSAAQLIYRTGDMMMAYRVVAIVTQLDRERGRELYNALSLQ